MVKLPGPNDQPARAVGERGSNRDISRYNWRYPKRNRNGESRNVLTEPTSLHELEALAEKTVSVMERHNPKADSNYEKAMDLLRLQYNMVSNKTNPEISC
jgi:hypothetical protein